MRKLKIGTVLVVLVLFIYIYRSAWMSCRAQAIKFIQMA